MSRHAHPTMADGRTHEANRPVDPHELGDWEETTEREFASDSPALAEAEHQVLADDDLDDDDDVDDLDDAPDEDEPDEDEEEGADDEDEDDFDDDDEDEEDEDDEGDEK